jgi:hypothetical protein
MHTELLERHKTETGNAGYDRIETAGCSRPHGFLILGDMCKMVYSGHCEMKNKIKSVFGDN